MKKHLSDGQYSGILYGWNENAVEFQTYSLTTPRVGEGGERAERQARERVGEREGLRERYFEGDGSVFSVI